MTTLRSGGASGAQELVVGMQAALDLLEVAIGDLGLFILFAMSFFRINSRLGWSRLGRARALVKALFTDFYGAPLSLFLLSGWWQPRLPGIERGSHAVDRLLWSALGVEPMRSLGVLQIAGFVIGLAGAAVVIAAWRTLYDAACEHRPAFAGPYAWVRHPLYLGFFIIMSGVLLLCPTLITLAMYGVLIVMYKRLARQDEQDARTTFGTIYEEYLGKVPAFIPRLRRT